MTEPDDPRDERPALERYLVGTFLIRDERRGGHAFSKFEAMCCDKCDDPSEGVGVAMLVRLFVDVSVRLHEISLRGQRQRGQRRK